MSETISVTPVEQSHHGVPMLEVSPEVWNTASDEEVMGMVYGELETRGIDPSTVVFSGFDDMGQFRRTQSFGDRSTTFAVSRSQIDRDLEQGGMEYHSPFRYLRGAEPYPYIGVFDASKMLSAEDRMPRKFLQKLPLGQLQKKDDRIFWATDDGSSLDTVTRLVIAFKTVD